MADTQTIKDRIDIVQLIGEYVTLKKAGVNWKANCPFHHEKTPSFMVHPEKQIWHCFGCSKGGDIFTFIQEMEGLDFIEALKLLAARAGVPVDTYQNEMNQSQRNRLLEINSAAANFFHQFLLEIPAAKPAREYLRGRQLSDETIGDWQIGFVPGPPAGGWELLTQYLLKKGHGIDDLVASGLTIKRAGADGTSGRGYYDRFRGRIMFPICDAHGNVVGFTGRVLVETETSGGKYVNTPQTLLYDKSRVLYGLHKAKTDIKAKDFAVIVEGQLDVITCHQAGMKNVVAASGTALTPEQVRLLKRYTQNAAMAFDADPAGVEAGRRGIGVALEEGMNVKVIQIPAGFAKDADECLKKNPAVWFKAVGEARPVMEWYLSLIPQKHNLRNPREKHQAAVELLGEVMRIPYAVERDDWVKRISEALHVEIEILRDELKKVRLPGSRNASVEALDASAPPAPPQTRLGFLLEELWSLIMKFPEHYAAVRGAIGPSSAVDSRFKQLYETAEKVYDTEQKLNLESLRQALGKAEGEPIADVLILRPYRHFEEITPELALSELRQMLTHLQEEFRKQRRTELKQAIAEAERAGDKETLEKLIRELQEI